MAARFWVGGSGTWDNASTSHWSTTTGGGTGASAPVDGDTVTFDGSSGTGTVTLGANPTATSVTCSTANITFAPAGFTITVTGAGTSWNITAGTMGSVNVTQTGASVAFAGGSKIYGTLTVTGSGTTSLGAGNTFTNLTRTGTNLKTDGFTINGNQTVTGTLTLGGNTTQGINRLLVQSNTPGTQRTITCTGAAVVISGDVDFMDIDITGSPSWTNTGSKYVGDALGNGSLITTNRTTPATQTATGTASFTWSTHGWTSRVPLPQDDVVINNAFIAGRTVTMDMVRAGKSIDFTGTTGTPALSTNAGGTVSVFGSFTLISGMSFGTFNNTLTFSGRSSCTITNATQTYGVTLTFSAPSGTYTLQDTFSSTGSISVTDGTFTTNNNAVTCSSFSAASRTAVLNLGTSLITLTSTTVGTIFNVNSTTTTLNGASATIVISTASTNTRTIALRNVGTGIGTITYTVAASPGILVIQSTATITTYVVGTLNVGSGRVFQVTSGVIVQVSNLNLNGTINGYLYLPGVSAQYISTPDAAPIRITGDIDVMVRVALDTWTPTSACSLLSKYTDGAGNRAYLLFMDGSTGKLRFYASTDGTLNTPAISSVTTGFSVGQLAWVRAKRVASTGVVTFYTSTTSTNDPASVSWSQLGTTQSTVSGNISNTTAPLEVGSYNGGVGTTPGNYYRAVVYSGFIDSGGTKVFDADFTTHNITTTNWLDDAKTQFAETSANTATVTINGAMAQAGGGRVVVNASTPGSAATISAAIGAVISAERISLQDSTATGGARFAAVQSVKVSNVTGWSVNEHVGWGAPV